jgi:hypothetical protein
MWPNASSPRPATENKKWQLSFHMRGEGRWESEETKKMVDEAHLHLAPVT